MTGTAKRQDPQSPDMTTLPPRTEYVLAMTNEERVSGLVFLADFYPEAFDAMTADIGRQRQIRARKAARDD